MATESCDGNSASHSSIALLQERFRKLQKAKEMREEKELLRLLSESGRRTNNSRARSYEQKGMLIHSEAKAGHIPERSQSTQRGSMEKMHSDLQGNEIPVFGNKFSSTSPGAFTQCYRTNNIDDDDNDSEVDTSLRL